MTDLDSARRFAQRPASTTHNVKAALDYSSVSFERGKSRTREGASTFPDVPSAGSGFEVCGAILSPARFLAPVQHDDRSFDTRVPVTLSLRLLDLYLGIKEPSRRELRTLEAAR